MAKEKVVKEKPVKEKAEKAIKAPAVKKPAKPKAPKKPKSNRPVEALTGSLTIGSSFKLANGKPSSDGTFRLGGKLYHVKNGTIQKITDSVPEVAPQVDDNSGDKE